VPLKLSSSPNRISSQFRVGVAQKTLHVICQVGKLPPPMTHNLWACQLRRMWQGGTEDFGGVCAVCQMFQHLQLISFHLYLVTPTRISPLFAPIMRGITNCYGKLREMGWKHPFSCCFWHK